ncbi:MAG: ribonuclease Z [Phocaeicola sp.]|nr:ribonuclease Z [Phocaeicola sp.]
MEKFEVNILGCGSALPTTRHNATSQVVNIREKLFMIDCGEGTQVQLRKSHLKFSRLNHIFISHLHGDHCFGLMGLISTFGMLERTADLHIYSHPDLKVLLNPHLDFFCKGMPYKVIFHDINPAERSIIYEDRSLTVETVPLKHRLPTCGFLFREKPTPNHIIREMTDFYKVPLYMMNRIKNGEDFVTDDGSVIPYSRLTTPSDPPRSYAYCSDTSYIPYITEQIQNVDVLFHEATFTDSEKARAKATQHSTARQAADIALKANARQLIIGHFSARYETEECLLNEAREVFPNTILANENLRIEIPVRK